MDCRIQEQLVDLTGCGGVEFADDDRRVSLPRAVFFPVSISLPPATSRPDIVALTFDAGGLS